MILKCLFAAKVLNRTRVVNVGTNRISCVTIL